MASRTAGFLSLLGLFVASSVVFTCTLVEFSLLQHRDSLSDMRQVDDGSSLSNLISPKIRDGHTYLGDDYPLRLPDFDPGLVRMSAEESVRFSVLDAEAPMEWSSMSPPGDGSVRLGPDDRVFLLSMFHELHCLRTFQRFLRHPERTLDEGHAQHCLNYLRQCSLCRADRTLEAGDFVARNFSSDRVGATHACRDWRSVFDRATYEWRGWMDRGPSSSEL